MDLNQVKSLFTATDYERGMEYYRQGRVTDMQCTQNDTGDERQLHRPRQQTIYGALHRNGRRTAAHQLHLPALRRRWPLQAPCRRHDCL